jgi:DNA-binding NarL/FixJ family response regulator
MLLKRIRILVVDDNALVRETVQYVISSETDMEVIAAASDGRQAVAKAHDYHPDMILMDLYMPRFSGLEAIPVIKSEMPEQRILIFTLNDRAPDILQALRSGGHGFLFKNSPIAVMLDTIRRFAAGEAIIPPPYISTLMTEFKENYADESIMSSVESQVMNMAAEGLHSGEIARRLLLIESTVNRLLARFMSYLHQAVLSKNNTLAG